MSSVIARAARVGVLSRRIVSHLQADPMSRRRPYAGVMQAVARTPGDRCGRRARAGGPRDRRAAPAPDLGAGDGLVSPSASRWPSWCAGRLPSDAPTRCPSSSWWSSVWPVVYSLTPIFVMFWGQFVPARRRAVLRCAAREPAPGRHRRPRRRGRAALPRPPGARAGQCRRTRLPLDGVHGGGRARGVRPLLRAASRGAGATGRAGRDDAAGNRCCERSPTSGHGSPVSCTTSSRTR